MFDENSLYFIEEQGKILFGKSMIMRSLAYFLDLNEKDYWAYYRKQPRPNQPKNLHSCIIWCRFYAQQAKNDDCTVHVPHSFSSIGSQKLRLEYWQELYDSYHDFVAKHNAKPHHIFTIPEVYFNYLYKFHGDKIEHMRPYISNHVKCA